MPDPQPNIPSEFLAVMERSAPYLAMCTGLRQQLIDQGWTPRGSEEVVVTLLRQGSGS